jgi:hypothetical protein
MLREFAIIYCKYKPLEEDFLKIFKKCIVFPPAKSSKKHKNRKNFTTKELLRKEVLEIEFKKIREK